MSGVHPLRGRNTYIIYRCQMKKTNGLSFYVHCFLSKVKIEL